LTRIDCNYYVLQIHAIDGNGHSPMHLPRFSGGAYRRRPEKRNR
jgi:hypothetical protein